MHYQRLRIHGDPLGRESKTNWIPDGQGYLRGWDYQQKRYVHQHRRVIEQALGRPLRRTELVHHKNGHRSDNRFVNLELCTTGQPPSQRVEDVLVWCRQYIRAYAPVVRKLEKAKNPDQLTLA